MGQSMKKVERWKTEMPTEQEMLPKDKYTVFDRKVKRYRKGIHSKWQIIWNRTADALGGRNRELGGQYECVLTACRGTQVDEGQPKTQSPGFLDVCQCDRWRVYVYSTVTIRVASYTALWKSGIAVYLIFPLQIRCFPLSQDWTCS